MIPTFSAFHVAGRAMEASQATINVTGNNIANINTTGYTRQRVDINAIGTGGVTQHYATAQVATGLGAKAVGVTQIRDPFLDGRYRNQSSEFKRYETTVAGLSNLEDVFDEASTEGLQNELSVFLNDLQRFSQEPKSKDIAQVTRTSAQKVTQIMNMYAIQIQEVRKQEVQNLDVMINNDFNSIVENIAKLNDQIRKEEIYGNTPNALYDQRNLLIDNLSEIAKIKVSSSPEKISDDLSVNQLKIELVNPKTGVSISIVDKDKFSKLSYTDVGSKVTLELEDTNGSVTSNVNDFMSDGSIRGHLNIINGNGSFASAGENDNRGIAYYENTMNVFAKEFATKFNEINDIGGSNNKPLFSSDNVGNPITAKNIQVSKEWLEDVTYINTTDDPTLTPGSSDNIIRMISAMQDDQEFRDESNILAFKGTFQEYLVGTIGDLALDVELNTNFKGTSQKVLQNIFDSRESVSGVSLNEEGINLMTYQKCYNAALRYFNILDENVSSVINSLGIH
jgi:flagellar hook-associated protein 1 FlgK